MNSSVCTKLLLDLIHQADRQVKRARKVILDVKNRKYQIIYRSTSALLSTCNYLSYYQRAIAYHINRMDNYTLSSTYIFMPSCIERLISYYPHGMLTPFPRALNENYL